MRSFAFGLTILLMLGCQPVTECERIQRNAEAGPLPTTLAAFGEYDVAHRHAVYSLLTTDQRASLWREHLAAFLAAHDSVLTADQVAFVRAEQARLRTMLSSPATAQAGCSSAYAVLGEDLAQKAVVQLGGVAPAGTAPACECAYSSNYNDCDGRECLSAPDCRVTWFGCGCYGLEVCNGMCE